MALGRSVIIVCLVQGEENNQTLASLFLLLLSCFSFFSRVPFHGENRIKLSTSLVLYFEINLGLAWKYLIYGELFSVRS